MSDVTHQVKHSSTINQSIGFQYHLQKQPALTGL